MSQTLAPYSGTWGFTQAAHLARRTLFGAEKTDIASLQGMSMSQAVDTLLAPQPDPSGTPLVWYHLDTVPDGQPWVDLAPNPGQDFNRSESLSGWYIYQMLSQNLSIREKMVLFWHNHFATGLASVGDARYSYKQNVLLRTNALGNFKELVKAITLDSAMLRYLSGNKNVAAAPNENYGRELQELFTIGKGPEITAGDYQTYSEADVKAAARVLTGWSDDPNKLSAVFTAVNHDPSDKRFSGDYGNAVIKGGSDQVGAERELDDLLTMIFAQNKTVNGVTYSVAHYICRKLYRWFIDYTIDANVEQNIINPLAQTFISNNYEIKPVVSQLLKSSWFYDSTNIGCMIKNPIDLVIGTMRVLGATLPAQDNITIQYYGWMTLRDNAANMQMHVLEPPNVAGWQEYYEAPQFSELWINSGTLNARISFGDGIATNKLTLTAKAGEYYANLDPTLLAMQSTTPSDPNLLISDLANLFYPVALTTDQMKTLHDQLLPGLPDYEWTNEWTAFTSDPANSTKKSAVSSKLQNLIKYMLEMAEYQLM